MGWVMSERKVIRAKRNVPGNPEAIDYVDKIFNVGDAAPEGHEGRPYTHEAGKSDAKAVKHSRKDEK